MTITTTRPSTGVTYTVTTEHSASSYGIPVVLQDGTLIDFCEDRNLRTDWNEGPATPAQEIASQMDALWTGMRVGAHPDREAMEMIDCAYQLRAYEPLATREARRMAQEQQKADEIKAFMDDNPGFFA